MNRRLIGTLFVIAVAVVVVLIVISKRFHPRQDTEQARKEATRLLVKVGGASKVCEEADQMFKQFGVAKLKLFAAPDLKDYPTIAALGKVDGIWPENPPVIQIRVGTHMDGYFILIVDTNGAAKYSKTSNEIEIASRIYVHR